MHRLVPRAPERVDGELDHQRDRLGRVLVGQLVEGAREAVAGLLVPPEKALHAGTGAGEPGPQRVRSRPGTIARASSSAAWLSAKRPTAVSAPRTREEQLDALLRRRGRGRRRSASANQCAALAGASRTASSPASRRTADGVDVALARRALDVVGARRRRGAARRERLGAPLVGPSRQPPGVAS